MKAHARTFSSSWTPLRVKHGNGKPAEGKDRVFLLATPGESGRNFIADEDGDSPSASVPPGGLSC